MPFPIKGSRIARRSRTATSRAYACVYNHGARSFLAKTVRMNYILAGAYRCFAPDFDLEFARFLMVKNKRQVNADQYVLPTRPLAHNLTLRTVCGGKNKKNILSMQIFIAFPSVFNIWFGNANKKSFYLPLHSPFTIFARSKRCSGLIGNEVKFFDSPAAVSSIFRRPPLPLRPGFGKARSSGTSQKTCRFVIVKLQ